MPYAQFNLAIDAVLIVILSLALLPKHPKFVLALFALYLMPWFLPLKSLGKLPTPAPQPAKVAETAPTSANPSPIRPFDPYASPQETVARTVEILKMVTGNLGTATGTGPAQAPSQIQPGNTTQTGSLTDVNTRMRSSMGDFQLTPDLVWFYLRIFWILAAFILWIQNEYIGTLALTPSLVPVFYLAFALPLIQQRISEQPWMKQASETVTDEKAGQTLVNQYSMVFVSILIALPTFLIVLLFWRQIKGVTGGKLKKFLQPDLYQVRFNGHLMDFRLDDKDIVIEGVHFNPSRFVQDRRHREIWRLGSGTEIEFVPRDSV